MTFQLHVKRQIILLGDSAKQFAFCFSLLSLWIGFGDTCFHKDHVLIVICGCPIVRCWLVSSGVFPFLTVFIAQSQLFFAMTAFGAGFASPKASINY
jgi:hypothetical protein